MGYVIVSALSLAAGFSLAAATLRPGPSRRHGGYLRPTASGNGRAPGRPTPATGTTAVSSSQPALGARLAVKVLRPTPLPPNSGGGHTVYGNATGGSPGPRPLAPVAFVNCGCVATCGDDGDTDGPGTCKGLPRQRTPLVEVVMRPRGARHE